MQVTGVISNSYYSKGGTTQGKLRKSVLVNESRYFYGLWIALRSSQSMLHQKQSEPLDWLIYEGENQCKTRDDTLSSEVLSTLDDIVYL